MRAGRTFARSAIWFSVLALAGAPAATRAQDYPA